MAQDLFGESSAPLGDKQEPVRSLTDNEQLAVELYPNSKGPNETTSEEIEAIKDTSKREERSVEGPSPISESDLSTLAEEKGFTESETAFIKENGLTKDAVDKLMEIGEQDLERNLEQLTTLGNQWADESEQAFSQEQLATYNETVMEHIDQDLLQLLQHTGIQNHPKFISLCLALASK